MRFNLSLPISPWPYLLTEPLISLQGDMSQGELPIQHDPPLKSPNLSMDSGFEGEKHFSHGDVTDDTLSWPKEASPNDSPRSPKKSTDDSDFNESPLEKKPLVGVEDASAVEKKSSEQECRSEAIDESEEFLEGCPCSVLSFTYFAKDEIPSDDYTLSEVRENAVGIEDDRSCDDNYSDDTLSVYYIPSMASIATEDCYSQHPVSSSETLKEDSLTHPPIPPPRTLKVTKLHRNKAHREADACVAGGSKYESRRPQSDPSTHYTTVVKPKAIRPPPINLDRLEYRVSLESLYSGRASAAFVRYRDRSAFRQHLQCVLSSGEGSSSFFSHSTEFPSRESPRSETPPASTSRSGNRPRAPRASSLTEVSKQKDSQHAETSSQCSSSPKEKLSKLDVATDAPETSCKNRDSESKRHSMPWDLFWTASPTVHQRPLSAHQADGGEPIHMTLEEVRSSLQTLHPPMTTSQSMDDSPSSDKRSPCRHFFRVYFRSRKSRKGEKSQRNSKDTTEKYRRSFPSSLKSAIVSWFKLKKAASVDERTFCQSSSVRRESTDESTKKPSPNTSPFTNRALPPLPRESPACSVHHLWEPSINVREESGSLSSSSDSENDNNHNRTSRKIDYAASIEKVKDYGWYWGPIGGETAENLLANEPDGSFVVRDSSDEHYIFSLTFKLNGLVRHVRIEHDHGNFSFGCLQKFRSNTIVDFIENAVAHSRSGRYLFFLHRRPILGPMRVQLLHPVSRFKQVQSLQHLCRFVILKAVRRDLIVLLPLPRRLKDYLNTPHYYSEELEQLSHQPSRTEDERAGQTT